MKMKPNGNYSIGFFICSQTGRDTLPAFLLKMYHNGDIFFAVLAGNVSLNRMTQLKKDTSKRSFALDVSML